jgi:hypothetical protein
VPIIFCVRKISISLPTNLWTLIKTAGEWSWRREHIGRGDVQASGVGDHGVALQLGQPPTSPSVPQQRLGCNPARRYTKRSSDPLNWRRQINYLACLINLHSLFESLRTVRALCAHVPGQIGSNWELVLVCMLYEYVLSIVSSCIFWVAELF